MNGNPPASRLVPLRLIQYISIMNSAINRWKIVHWAAVLILGAGLAGCQANKHPTAKENTPINPMGQPETAPPPPETVAEPAPIGQPVADQGEIHRLERELQERDAEIAQLKSKQTSGAKHRANGPAPRLDNLHATYDADTDTLTVIVPGKLLFSSGSAKVNSAAHSMLNKIASAIERQYPGHRIYVDGHTDKTPIHSSHWANNHALAAARALSVAEYLMQHGIKEDQIVVRAYGPINPKSTREASRRVEIVVQVR